LVVVLTRFVIEHTFFLPPLSLFCWPWSYGAMWVMPLRWLLRRDASWNALIWPRLYRCCCLSPHIRVPYWICWLFRRFHHHRRTHRMALGLLGSATAPPPLHSAVPPSKQPQLLQIHGRPSAPPSGASLMTLPSSGIQLRASTFAASDENTTYMSVVWCGYPRQLCRPFFNRYMAQSLHPTILASGDTSAHRRRVHLRLRHGGFVVALVKGPSCNTKKTAESKSRVTTLKSIIY
jgi:hypothetical protein